VYRWKINNKSKNRVYGSLFTDFTLLSFNRFLLHLLTCDGLIEEYKGGNMSVWQVEDNYTEPTISPEMRQQLLREAAKTRQIDTQKFDLESRTFTGNALLQKQTTVLFALIDSDLVLPVHIRDRVIIGRRDWESNEQADIDLAPYSGRERGVSRQHAALHRSSHVVSLVDLNSSNGTYINGTKLLAYQPRLLREGDQICFGNMCFRITFDV
jgi:hypothetical protein